MLKHADFASEWWKWRFGGLEISKFSGEDACNCKPSRFINFCSLYGDLISEKYSLHEQSCRMSSKMSCAHLIKKTTLTVTPMFDF